MITSKAALEAKGHKTEKGVRRPGSLGHWHPAHVVFRVPMAGQLGMFTRVSYNNKIIDMGKAEKKFTGIKNFGLINFIISNSSSFLAWPPAWMSIIL